MLGSASQSLLYVALNQNDVYFEENIMIWDVAAGICLVEGSGGNIYIKKGKIIHSLNVIASKNDKFKKII